MYSARPSPTSSRPANAGSRGFGAQPAMTVMTRISPTRALTPSDDRTESRQTEVERVLVLGVTSKTFTRDELASAFEKFEATVDRAAQTRDWDPWVEQYSPDITYIEHAAGTMRGREEDRAWIWKDMASVPRRYMSSCASLCAVI